MDASVLIRVKNERETLAQVLSLLKAQTVQSFEVIVVDDNSTDGSDTLAYQFFDRDRVKVVTVPEGSFTHPYSCNLGAQAASGKYLVYLNGHAFPISHTWLEDGLYNFAEENVAGVFAYPFANKKAGNIEKLRNHINALVHSQRIVFRRYQIGVLGTTNAIIRKSLWEEYNFNEGYIEGGEDGDWARYWLSKNYVIIHDPQFRVYHSHNLPFIELLKEQMRWIRMSRPLKDEKRVSAANLFFKKE
jgi:glycosyltransferase involved in cell wall biosynthesis